MGLLDESLYGLELRLELKAVERGVQRYRRDRNDAEGRGDGAALSPARRLLMGWFDRVEKAITAEQDGIRAGEPAPRRGIYGRALLELSADKIAVITMHYALGACLRRPRGVRIPSIVEGCGRAVNAEVNLPRIRRDRDAYYSMVHRRRQLGTDIVQRVAREFLVSPSWGRSVHIHLGVCLIRLLMENCVDDGEPPQPAFRRRLIRRGRRTPGFLSLSERMMEMVQRGHHWRELREPVYQPMVCQPMPWTDQAPGGYLRQRITLITKLHATGKRSPQAEWLESGNMAGVFAAINALQATPWRINPRILAVVSDLWDSGGGFGRIPRRDPYEKPPFPAEAREDQVARKTWNKAAVLVYRANGKRLAEAVNFDAKLDVARRFAERSPIFFPHNLDFRGRTYSVPLHLNHQGDDICRGLLEFAEGKVLDDTGLRWLMIHMANCAGIDRVAYEDRVHWVLDNEDTIRGWAEKPLDNTGWLEHDKPFELLAAAIAFIEGGPCHIPVQLDASNNGLQHYAAILRDSETAALVNLVDSEQPADLYAHVAEIVSRQVALDAADRIEAKLLEGAVSRSLIKQTVMTTLYGVTEVGARRQIQAKLEAAGVQVDWDDPERTPWQIARYLAGVVLDVMPGICPAASAMMDWLTVAGRKLIGSHRAIRWVSPIGLPVLQPYFRRSKKERITTILQSLTIAPYAESRGPMVRRQVQGFAPNWIHSIDAAHMMNVAIAAEAHGIRLAAVHDSFWTHAADAEALSRIVRHEFVAMHARPLGEVLAEQLAADYPTIKLPPPPTPGAFDLKETLGARYFVS